MAATGCLFGVSAGGTASEYKLGYTVLTQSIGRPECGRKAFRRSITDSNMSKARKVHHRNPLRARRTRAANRALSTSTNASTVLRHIRELFRVSQQHFQRIEARCGVSGALLWAMAELKVRPGMKISDLARALSVRLSTASNLLDRLEAKALIRRERGSRDQRIVRVYLTPEGQRILRAAPKPAEGVIPDALHKMPAAALVRLDRDLEKLLKLMKVRSREAAMQPLAEPLKPSWQPNLQ